MSDGISDMHIDGFSNDTAPVESRSVGSTFMGIDMGSTDGDYSVFRCSCGWIGQLKEMGRGSDFASKYYECPNCKLKYD